MEHRILNFVCNIFFLLIFIKNGLCQQQPYDEIVCSQHPSSVIVANPYDCHSFYVCQHGNAMKVTCPDNSIFNTKVGNCDLDHFECIEEEEEVDVALSVTDKKDLLSEDMAFEDDENDEANSETTELSNSTQSISLTTGSLTPTETTVITTVRPTTVTPTPTTVTPTTVTPTTVTQTTEDPSNCETCSETTNSPYYVQCPLNDTENPSFLASDSYCDSFYLCYHGRPFEMFCSTGFYWNQERKECILERESNCTDSTVGNKVPRCPLNGQHFFPHSERCNLFYYCENGIRSIQQCTAFKQWDIIEQTCKLDISARCIKTIPRSQRSKYYT